MNWLKRNFEMLIPYLVFFFSPILPVLIATGILVFMDLVTGTAAAKARGEQIRSKKMIRTISKMIFYFIAIILSKIMECVFFPVIPLATITAGYIALMEFKSNIENISSITGINIWKVLINKIHQQKK